MAAAQPTEYVLGTGADELERLGLQHQLWSDAAHDAWKRARIEPGQSVLDVGCGPGYAAFDLAQIVQSSGRVVGVDESANFVEHVNAQARTRRLPQLSARVGDVQDLSAALKAGGTGGFDLAYARWVMCFVPHPERVIAGVAAALAPGGRVVIHDYFNYEVMTPAPRRESYRRVVAATARSWRGRGGDPDIVARVPRMMHEHGLRVEHLAAHQRVARPGDSMWHWGTSWWRNYVPKLVAMGELTPAQGEEYFADMDAMKRETDFLVLPPVFEVIAVKA